MPEPKKVKLICPECDKEVELVDGEGVCGNCNLDVGWVVEKRRRDRAIRKMDEREEGETRPKTKKRFSF